MVEFEVDGRTTVQRAKQRSLVLWIDGQWSAVPCYPGWHSWTGMRIAVSCSARAQRDPRGAKERRNAYGVRTSKGRQTTILVPSLIVEGAGSYEPATWGGGVQEEFQPVGGRFWVACRVTVLASLCAAQFAPLSRSQLRRGGRAMEANRAGDGRRLLVGSRAVSVAR